MKTSTPEAADTLTFDQVKDENPGCEIIAALFCGRHIAGQLAAIMANDNDGTDWLVTRYKCTQGGEPTESQWVHHTGADYERDFDAITA